MMMIMSDFLSLLAVISSYHWYHRIETNWFVAAILSVDVAKIFNTVFVFHQLMSV